MSLVGINVKKTLFTPLDGSAVRLKKRLGKNLHDCDFFFFLVYFFFAENQTVFKQPSIGDRNDRGE